MNADVELDERERDTLISGLEILSPDSFEAQDALEVLTQRLLGMVEEPGEVAIRFDLTELELSIAALEILSPEDFEVQEIAEALEDRLRIEHNALEEGPDIA